MIKFQCKGCKTPHSAHENFMGLTAMCTKCGAKFKIPNTKDELQAESERLKLDLVDQLAEETFDSVEIGEESEIDLDALSEVTCPRCDRTVDNPQDYLGCHHRCMDCGHPFLMPETLDGFTSAELRAQISRSRSHLTQDHRAVEIPRDFVDTPVKDSRTVRSTDAAHGVFKNLTVPGNVATVQHRTQLEEEDLTLDQLAAEIPDHLEISDTGEISDPSAHEIEVRVPGTNTTDSQVRKTM